MTKCFAGRVASDRCELATTADYKKDGCSTRAANGATNRNASVGTATPKGYKTWKQ